MKQAQITRCEGAILWSLHRGTSPFLVTMVTVNRCSKLINFTAPQQLSESLKTVYFPNSDSLQIIFFQMATVVAQSHYIFGLRTGVRNNLLYSDEQTVIFPSGNNCVRYNIDQKCQRFIPGRFTTMQIAKKIC